MGAINRSDVEKINDMLEILTEIKEKVPLHMTAEDSVKSWNTLSEKTKQFVAVIHRVCEKPASERTEAETGFFELLPSLMQLTVKK